MSNLFILHLLYVIFLLDGYKEQNNCVNAFQIIVYCSKGTKYSPSYLMQAYTLYWYSNLKSTK